MQLMSQDYHENSFDLLFTQQDPETPRDPTLGTAKNSFPSFSSRQEFGGNSNPPPPIFPSDLFIFISGSFLLISFPRIHLLKPKKPLLFVLRLPPDLQAEEPYQFCLYPPRDYLCHLLLSVSLLLSLKSF